MAYVCAKCGKQIKSLSEGMMCLYCGGRIILKERSSLAREVSTD
ncbi:MAG: DNA-directed RNA polymerase subunit P [Candidatus Micrarchaeia archaeon]